MKIHYIGVCLTIITPPNKASPNRMVDTEERV